MKQYIAIEQLRELTPEQQIKLREWWQPQKYERVAYTYRYNNNWETSEILIKGLYNHNPTKVEEESDLDGEYVFMKDNCLPLLNIGQCIEYLRKYDLDINDTSLKDKEWCVDLNRGDSNLYLFRSNELIDALWEAIKTYLL